jgi:hypothetical protein
VPRSSQLIERFIVRQGNRVEEVPGSEGGDPAGFVRGDPRTTAIVAYESRPSSVELPPAKFEDYLRQYGLEQVIALRAQRGEREKPGEEIFARCAKTLLTGARPSLAVTQPVGLLYEIVPSADPTHESRFSGRVLCARTPVAGALVVAILRDDPRVRLSARSDARGAFAFALPRAGVWLIKSVQMIDAPRGSGAEWESLWASLTFELR